MIANGINLQRALTFPTGFNAISDEGKCNAI